jgi:D-alanine-D-alanine ligase
LYDNICRQGEQLYDFFGLKGIVRIDFIIQNNAPFLIEINSIPGLSPASIVPQQLEYKGWQLQDFFGRLLLETIQQHK